jgi:hypothetical protein
VSRSTTDGDATTSSCETQVIYDPETCNGPPGDGDHDPDGAFYTYTTAEDGSEAETWFSDTEPTQDCPPGFNARYHSAAKNVWFNGRSRLSMAQWDEYHTYRLFTYEYEGYSTDGKWKVNGIHHVAANLCGAAQWSYWTGVSAYFARLHLERYSSLASGASWGGGGSGDDDDDNCRTEYVIVEVSNDGGATWSTYWEGYATVCE